MSNSLIEYRFRLRDAANTTDVLVVTSVRGDSLPWISQPPSGDGASLDWLSGKTMSGQYTGKIIDAITGGTSRVFTALTEDTGKRQQLGQRRAFWEFRINGGAWQVLYAGRLSRYKLDNDIEWTLVVSDWMQAEHEFTLFAPTGPAETITSFLARFPNRGCLFGGPLGTVLGKSDPGGWTMRVYDAGTPGRTRYRLELVSVNEPVSNLSDAFSIVSRIARINAAVNSLPQTPANFGTGTYSTVQDTQTPGLGWAGLAVLVNGVPFRANYRSTYVDKEFFRDGSIIIDGGEGQSPLTPFSLVRVRALTIPQSNVSPIYLDAHPVDLLNTLETMGGIPVNAASLTTVRNVLGTQVVHRLRITQPEQLGALLEREIYGPYGIGARPDATGAIELFSSRTFPNVAPGTVIGIADVADDSTVVFDLNTGGAVKQVNFEHHQLTQDASVPDGVIDTTYRFERGNGDPDAIGTGVVNYEIKGFIDFGNAQAAEMQKWVYSLAQDVFDRRGRGEISARTQLLRTGAGANVKLGDEIIFQHPAVVNHNKRYGDDNTVGGRAMQVTHWTPGAATIEVELEDSGPNAQALTPGPTLTIAQSVDDPRHIAVVTITNAATLIAAGHSVRMQFATTTGVGPSTTDYTTFALYNIAEIPTTVRLPSVFNGRTVYVRARSEKSGFRPSDYSTPQHVALDAINAPSGLSATPVGTDGSMCDLEWAIGANAGDCVSDIYVRTQGTGFSTTGLVASVSPGTTRYRLMNLTPGALLTATVIHRFAPLGDQSAQANVNFTASAATHSLAAPLFPNAFAVSGRAGGLPVADGTYGIGVVAVEIPGTVEVAVAVETSPGAGTFGSFNTLGSAASIGDDWTIVRGTAPNDGLLRRLKARHIGAGQTPSAYTATVDVDPWVLTFLPVFNEESDLVITGVSYVGTNCRISFTSTDVVEFNVNNGAFNIATSPIIVAQTADQQDVVVRATHNGRTKAIPIAVAATGGSSSPSFGTATATSVTLVNDANNTLRTTWTYSGSLADKFDVFIDEGGGFSLKGTTGAGATSFDWDSSIDYTSGAGGSPSVTVNAKVRPTDGTNVGSDSNTVSNTINVV